MVYTDEWRRPYTEADAYGATLPVRLQNLFASLIVVNMLIFLFERGSTMKGYEFSNWLVDSMVFAISSVASGQQPGAPDSSYLPVVIKETPASIQGRMEAAKPEIMNRQLNLLRDRYDLSDHPTVGVTMTRGKAIQDGARTKLPPGMSWEALGALSPEQIKDKGLFPSGFMPLPIPTTREGEWSFRDSTSTRSRSKRAVTSRGMTWISTCLTDSCPSFPLRSTSRRARTSATFPRARSSLSRIRIRFSTAS